MFILVSLLEYCTVIPFGFFTDTPGLSHRVEITAAMQKKTEWKIDFRSFSCQFFPLAKLLAHPRQKSAPPINQKKWTWGERWGVSDLQNYILLLLSPTLIYSCCLESFTTCHSAGVLLALKSCTISCRLKWEFAKKWSLVIDAGNILKSLQHKKGNIKFCIKCAFVLL